MPAHRHSRDELVEFRTGQLAADDTSRQIYDAISRRREMQGIKTVQRRDGELVRCQYQAILTSVATMPHYLLMLGPESPGVRMRARQP